MKKIKYLILGIILSLPLFTNSAFAFDIRTGDNIVISEPVMEDLYLFSGSVTINADVLGDVYVLGGTVNINGNISEDLVVIGGKVVVMGTVGDDLRILGGQISVYSTVIGDLIMAGGTLDLGSIAKVNGGVFASGGVVSIDGSINKDLIGTISVLVLNGQVMGNVNVTIENMMSFSEKSLVMGDFTYRKLIEANVPAGVVKGKVKYMEFSSSSEENGVNTALFLLIYKSFSLVNALFIALLFVILSPKILEKAAEVSKVNLFKTFAVGLLSSILVFIGIIILLMTIFGVQLAIIFGFAFGAVLYLSKIFAASLLASYIVDFKKKKYLKIKLFFAMALTLSIYYLIGMTPFIGWILNMVLFTFGLGSLVLVKQYYFLYLRNKNQI